MHRSLTILAALLMGTAAGATSPVGSDSFNLAPGFDLSTLTAANFHEVIDPIAKAEGGLTFLDFTNSFGPLFQDHLLPEFEQKYGLTVTYVRGSGDTAVQQLIAATNSAIAAPADVYFVSSGASLSASLDGGVMANIPLQDVLPNMEGVSPELAVTAGGRNHGGTYMPFHRNQTSLVYNTAIVPADEAPQTLDDLLAWAKAHPGKLAVTSPAGGGSGTGFMQSVAYALVQGDDCRPMLTDYAATPDQISAFMAGDCLAPVWDYYRELLPVAEITNGNSDTLNLIANGAAAIGTGWEDMAYDFIGRGLLPPTTAQLLLETGQVGGGDGMFLAARASHPAAGLLFLDFMTSHDVQLEKLRVNGSRSARTDLNPEAEFTPEQAGRLLPTDQFATRTMQNVPQPLLEAMKDAFAATVLRQ